MCLNILQEITQSGNLVKVEWIKGHADHTGNELADYLAKEATKLNETASDILMPKGTVKYEINKIIQEEHDFLWRTEPGLRQSKEMMNDIQPKTVKYVLKQNKSTMRKIIAIATGHNTLNYHMKNKGYVENDECRACGESEETGFHIAFECPAFETKRREILVGMDKTDTLTKALKLMKEFEMFEEVMKANQN